MSDELATPAALTAMCETLRRATEWIANTPRAKAQLAHEARVKLLEKPYRISSLLTYRERVVLILAGVIHNAPHNLTRQYSALNLAAHLSSNAPPRHLRTHKRTHYEAAQLIP